MYNHGRRPFLTNCITRTEQPVGNRSLSEYSAYSDRLLMPADDHPVMKARNLAHRHAHIGQAIPASWRQDRETLGERQPHVGELAQCRDTARRILTQPQVELIPVVDQ